MDKELFEIFNSVVSLQGWGENVRKIQLYCYKKEIVVSNIPDEFWELKRSLSRFYQFIEGKKFVKLPEIGDIVYPLYSGYGNLGYLHVEEFRDDYIILSYAGKLYGCKVSNFETDFVVEKK